MVIVMCKKVCILLICLLICPVFVDAQKGCCSHHGGVYGCSSTGRQICNDGSLSPSCTCTPPVNYVYGCTDRTAKNYNSSANVNDGSCIYYVLGCTDSSAKNYNLYAEKDDGSCQYYVLGCTNELASNYDPLADKDDGSCLLKSNDVNNNDTKNINDEESSSDDDVGYFIVISIIVAFIYLCKKGKIKIRK